MWVDASIVPIPHFGVDIPVSSQGIQFCTRSSGSELDDEVELT